MPASNIGESDVIGLSRNLREKRREGRGVLYEKSIGENRLVLIEHLPCKTKTLELNIYSRNFLFICLSVRLYPRKGLTILFDSFTGKRH